MSQMNALVIVGTRPEKIKLSPVQRALRARGWKVETFVTGQSPDLVDSQPTQPPWDSLMEGISRTWSWGLPPWTDVVIVAGDTASAFAGALAGFLADVPVAHVEAGLRTYRRNPWPEEQFRRMICAAATWHFCPDERARVNVLMEHGCRTRYEPASDVVTLTAVSDIADRVFVTGNPVVDDLPRFDLRVLATMHRREHWGEVIQDVLTALGSRSDVEARVISHPNWQGRYDVPESVTELEPMEREAFIDEMVNADVVVTDSGGLQEEAARLGVPCWCVREATERQSLVDVGAVEMIWPPSKLRERLAQELAKRQVYGDGDAGERIADVLTEKLGP